MYRNLLVLMIFLLSTQTQAGLYRTEFYCHNDKLMKCYIGPYAHECEYTGKKCKDVTFSSIGMGYKCYPNNEDPQVQAEKNAFNNAQNICGAQNTYKISSYSYLPTNNVCILKISADFICMRDLHSLDQGSNF